MRQKRGLCIRCFLPNDLSPRRSADLFEHRFTGHQIEMASAGILEEGNVARGTTAFHRTAGEIVEIAEHVSLRHHAIGDRLKDIADAVECGFAAVHEYPPASHGLVIRLAGLRRVAAD